MIRMVLYFVLFSIVGIAQESFWTGLFNSIKTKNPRLKTRSSLWMFLIYGCVLFVVMFVQWWIPGYPWWVRGFAYMVMIFSLEYLSGFVIKKVVGVAPWDYSTDKTYDHVGSKKPFQIDGLICLSYAPVWFVGGLIFEYLYLFLQTL